MTIDEGAKRRAALLERLAMVLEGVGFPRPTARVYAALTMAEGEGLSTSELTDRLDISKASVTNAMHFLVGTELVQRYRVPGSREAYYRILKGKWGEILGKKFAAMSIITQTAQEALDAVDSELAKERLREMYDVYSFFEEEFRHVMERWSERKSS